MPDSLLTTKRKFYKFLDNLSQPASSSNSSTSTNKRPVSTSTIPNASLSTTSTPPRPTSRPLSSTSTTTSPARQQTPEERLNARLSKRLRPSSSAASLASYRARLSNPPPPTSAAVYAGDIGRRGLAFSVGSARPVSSGHGAGRPVSGIAGIGRSVSTAGGTGAGKGVKRRSDGSRVASTGRGVAVAGQEEGAAGTGLPPFCPWSHEGFVARLRTFAPVTAWLPKPDERVGEVAWAKRGWACVGTETVGCRGCGKRVVVDFSPSRYGGGKGLRSQGEEEEGFGSARIVVHGPDGEQGEVEEDVMELEDVEDGEDYEEAFEKGLVEKYAALVVYGHGQSCLWRQSGCKDDIYRLPVVRSAWWQSEVKAAYQSAVTMGEEVQALKLKPIDGRPPVEKILRDLPGRFLAAPDPNTSGGSTPSKKITEKASASSPHAPGDTLDLINPELQRKALTIALTGWHATTESSTHLLTCSACFQRIGLWMYQTDYRPPSPTKASSMIHDGDDDENREDEDDTAGTLDLIEQHREHCPYRNATSQAALGDYAGWPAWRILWDVMGRYADEQRRRSRDRYGLGGAASPAGNEEAEVAEVNGVVQHAGDEDKENGEGEKVQLSREEILKMDRERTKKLRKLKRVLGFKFRMPAVVGEKAAVTAEGGEGGEGAAVDAVSAKK